MTLAMKQELTLQKGKKQQRKILNKKDANGLNWKKYNKKKIQYKTNNNKNNVDQI